MCDRLNKVRRVNQTKSFLCLDKIKEIIDNTPYAEKDVGHIITGLLGIALITAHTHQDQEAREAARSGVLSVLARHPRAIEIADIFSEYLKEE
jgi:hypothetical protein